MHIDPRGRNPATLTDRIDFVTRRVRNALASFDCHMLFINAAGMVLKNSD
jgi:hypothetical protein